ncbi:MAG: SDR family oxidoreductase [Rhodobacteraceae bacterium]|nr:SDR family oxidoreductase [Paracoccaceae bacterium]
MKLNEKVILITGASRGIGAATARHLAAEGMSLALAGRDVELLEAVAKDCQSAGANTAIFPGDMRDESYLNSLGTAIQGHFGALHVLFNNAGIFPVQPLDEADIELWDTALDVNFKYLVHLTKSVLPLLLEHPESAVINLCSVAGREAFGGGGIYCATKFALHAFSQCLFEDMRAKGMKVASIYPGFVDTDMTTNVPGDREKMIGAIDVAQTVSFMLKFPPNVCPTEVVLRPQFQL